MKQLYSFLLVVFASVGMFTVSLHAQLSVIPSNNATALAQNLVGTGVAISNITLNCAPGGSGTFTANNSNLGLNAGMLLTSGAASNAVGPNNSGSVSACPGYPGDQQLTAISGQITYDACVLEFDFVPSTNNVAFQYVFGSDEYPEYVNSSYNDVFAFFVTGPNPGGGTYNNVNIALIPNTSIPVTINNVNANSYSQYYINNLGGQTVEYDGFTTVLTSSLSVVACQSYHIKIAIADGGDCGYDSGVFLKSNSFNSGNFVATVVNQTNASCSSGGSATVSASGGNGPYTYTWNTNPVQNGPTATNLTPGTYTCTVSYQLCGNTFTTTAQVTILGPTPVTPTVNNIVHVSCNGGTNGSASVSATGGSGNYTYTWAPGNLNGSTQNNLPAGTYTITATDQNGCTGTTTVTITQPQPLFINPGSVNPVSCFGGANGWASIVGSGGTGQIQYSWSPGGGTGPVVNNLTAGVYTITATDQNGCTASTTITITQPPQLNVSVSNVVQPLCYGGTNGSATVIASGGTLGNGYQYSWAPNGGNSPTGTNLSAGNYTVTVTDANGCTAQAIAQVGQPPQLVVNISNTTPVSCNGGSNGSANVLASGGTSGYTYVWNPGNIPGPSANNLLAGNYTVTVTDAHNCTANTVVNIAQPNPVSVNILASNNVSCFGGTNGSATAGASGGTGPNYSYHWMPVNLTGNTVNSLNQGTYTVTATDQNGCTGTTTITITEPPAITSQVSNVISPTCNGGTNGAATIQASGGTGGFIYTWNPGNMQGSSPQNLSNGTYTITITDANGCVATNSVTLTAPPFLNLAAINLTDVSCFGMTDGSGEITASGGNPGYTYSWMPNVSNGPQAGNLAPGYYTVTITDQNNCYDTIGFAIHEPALLTLHTFASDDSICAGNPVQLFATGQGGSGNYYFTWNNTQPGDSIQITPGTSGTYYVVALDDHNCAAAGSIFIHVAPAPNPSFSFNNACEGSPVLFTGQAPGNITVTSWDFGDNSPLANGNTASHTYNGSGVYQVTFSVISNEGCTGSVTQTVYTAPAPIVDFLGDLTRGCAPLCVSFSDLSNGNGEIMSSWRWLANGNLIAETQDPAYCFQHPGNYDITLEVTTQTGCTGSLNLVDYIQVYPVPDAFFATSDDKVSIMNPSVQFTNLSTNGHTYEWLFGDGTGSGEEHPVHVYPDTGKYCIDLVVTSAQGCKDDTKHCIYVFPEFGLYIPNTFTPDGDGLNEIFKVYGQQLKDFTMHIFNRWGEVVFMTENPEIGWNGKAHNVGIDAEQSVYTYRIHLRDGNLKEHELVGQVNLLR